MLRDECKDAIILIKLSIVAFGASISRHEMKYLIFLAIVTVVLLIIREVITAARTYGKGVSLREKWRNLGGRIHIIVGVLSALIIISYTLRILFHAITGR